MIKILFPFVAPLGADVFNIYMDSGSFLHQKTKCLNGTRSWSGWLDWKTIIEKMVDNMGLFDLKMKFLFYGLEASKRNELRLNLTIYHTCSHDVWYLIRWGSENNCDWNWRWLKYRSWSWPTNLHQKMLSISILIPKYRAPHAFACFSLTLIHKGGLLYYFEFVPSVWRSGVVELVHFKENITRSAEIWTYLMVALLTSWW